MRERASLDWAENLAVEINMGESEALKAWMTTMVDKTTAEVAELLDA